MRGSFIDPPGASPDYPLLGVLIRLEPLMALTIGRQKEENSLAQEREGCDRKSERWTALEKKAIRHEDSKTPRGKEDEHRDR